MIWLLLVLSASADDKGHPLLPTLADWVERSTAEYKLDDISPSRAYGAYIDLNGHWVEASMGAIKSEKGWRTRPGRVELVVGDGLDSSRFRAAPHDPLSRPNFAVDNVEIAMARDLWLTTDYSFKAAVKQYQIKTASLAQLGSAYPPDWSASEPVQYLDGSSLPEIDKTWLHDVAVNGSQVLRDLGGLRNAEVHSNMTVGQYVFADSDGTRLTQGESAAVVYAWTDVLRDDGVQVYEYKQWVAGAVEDLPSEKELLLEIRHLGERVKARANAAQVDFYEGPVVFEDDAAVDFFRFLAIPETLGTPPEPRPGQTYDQQMRDQPRLGRRLLGVGWDIVDDPAATPAGLAGGYRHDREGVAAERVETVVDGYVSDLLMSRVPRHDLARSNGHSRGDIQSTWLARESVWRITPDRNLSDRAFDKRLDKTMRESNSDRVLVVRNLERGRAGSVPSPTDAVWRYADGTEEPVLALEFQNVDRRTLRDVVASGDGEWVRPYLAPFSPGATAMGSQGLPAIGIGPRRILIAEMELVFPGGNRQPHVLEPPPL